MRSGSAVLLITAFALFAHNAHGADCEKDTFRLGSQEDVDALSDCPTLTGDVVIAATAEGSIDLDGIEKISGSISNEECFEGASDDESTQTLLDGDLEAWKDCRGLESLSGDTLNHITGDFTLQSLVDITEVDFKNLEGVNGTLHIEFLPHLERMNLSSLELAESVLIRHNRQLANFTMSKLNNVTAEDSVVELVDLGIYQWPRINIRIQRPDEEPPRRRLERLLVKDLPNISLFELNNADEFGLLEIHGFPNQTAQLTTEYAEVGPLPGWRFTEPVAAIDNFTISGFGGRFNIALLLTDPKSTVDITHVRMVNTNMTDIGLSSLGKPQSLYVANNPDLEGFSMPGDMKTAEWEAIEFDSNPRLFFGEKDLDAPQLVGWYWGMNTSVLSIKGSPMEPDFTDYMSGRITERLVIEPSGNDNVTRVCSFVKEWIQEGDVVAPDGGYTCGGEHYEGSAAAIGVGSYSTALVVVACLVSWVSAIWIL